MSQDAYSPLTGRWGVEGVWDAVVIGLAIAGLALLVLVLARTRAQRAVALLAALLLIPTYLGLGWLGNVQVAGPDGDGMSCLLEGPVDTETACGAAYLGRYVALMVPLTLVLVTLAVVVAFEVRGRFRQRAVTAS